MTNFACNRRYDRRKEIHHTPEITENHVTVFEQVFSALKMLRGAAIKSWKQVQTLFQENLSERGEHMGEYSGSRAELPKNIRQIGERDEVVRLYVEDYVNT